MTGGLRLEGRCILQCVMLICENIMPVTVAAQSETSTVFAHSNTGIVGSNSTRVTDVCVRLFCVCVVLCVDSGLATD
jgi:hypothetical protein